VAVSVPSVRQAAEPKPQAAEASRNDEVDLRSEWNEEDDSAKRDAAARRESLAAAYRDERLRRRQEIASDWGETRPAATDWLRRDAAELMWKSRQSQWGVGPSPPRLAASSDARPFGESEVLGDDTMDDWRMGEFDMLLRRENKLRKRVMRWWLDFWDSSGDDYLFDESELYEPDHPRFGTDRRWPQRPRRDYDFDARREYDFDARRDYDVDSNAPTLGPRGRVQDSSPQQQSFDERAFKMPRAAGGGREGTLPSAETEDIDWLLEPSSRSTRGIEQRQAELVVTIDERLRRLHDALLVKVEELEAREAAATAEEAERRQEIKQMRAQQAAYVWPDELSALPSSYAQAEQQLRAKQAEHSQLYAQRMALGDALDTALARVTELQQVGATIRSGGIPALKQMLARRQLSRPLHTFLRGLL